MIKSDLDFVNKDGRTLVKKNGKIVAFIGERPHGGFYYAFGKPSASHYMSFDVDDYETAVSRIKEFAEEGEGVFSSRKITSAVDGGWRVDSSDVPEALDLFVEYFGEETALEEIAKAMGDYTLRENLEWIAQQFGIAEDLEDSNTWDMYDEMLEVMGVSELFNNLTQAAGYDELAEDLAFIFRQYDFREWDKYD